MRKKITLLILGLMMFGLVGTAGAEETIPDLNLTSKIDVSTGYTGVSKVLGVDVVEFKVGNLLNFMAEYRVQGKLLANFSGNLKITKDDSIYFNQKAPATSAVDGVGGIGVWGWKPTEPGVYKMEISIDPANEVVESNENNNVITKFITIVSDEQSTSSKVEIVSPSKGQEFIQGDSIKIKWTGGKEIVQIDIVGKNAANSASGFNADGLSMTIKANNLPNSEYIWDGKRACSTDGLSCRDIVPGAYKILLISKSTNGNLFYGNDGPGGDIANYDLSDESFVIKSKEVPNVVRYPGLAIEPSKKVYQSNENLVVTLKRLDGQNAPYLVDLWASKSVSIGESKKYKIQANVPVGAEYTITSDIDQMEVFQKGGNGEYSLVTCPTFGCVKDGVFYSNAAMININGFPVAQSEDKEEIKNEEKHSSTDTQLTTITNNAKSLKDGKIDELLAQIKQLRNELKEQAAELKYLKTFAKEMKVLNTDMQSAIKTFITYGVDDNTKKLGEGERAAVVSSYKSAFDKLPETEAELADAIKIANGRFPSINSDKAEKKAKEQFIKIYKRVADMNDAKDAAAIKVMAYGLRQKAENRNMNSEKNGIKIFKTIYGNNPKTTDDWNTMQAITYSGASRKADSDGDLLSDETEKILGTDLNNPDSDGDGYKDGTEVNGGYDPLKK